MKQRRIAVAIRKGGVGRSTTAAHLAAGLAMAGREVMLVDVDPQGHLAILLGVEELTSTVAEVLEGRVGPVQAATKVRERLWLLGSDVRLAAVESSTLNRAFDPHLILREQLGALQGFDYIILDTPRSLCPLAVNALFCASEVLAPIEVACWCLDGLNATRDELAVYSKRGGPEIRYVLPTMLRRSTKMYRELLPRLSELLGDQVLPGVRDYQLFRELCGELIYEVDPSGRGSRDYAAVTREVLDDEEQGP